MKLEDREKQKRQAARSNRRRLNRKYAFYDPLKTTQFQIAIRKSKQRTLNAPEQFSIIHNHDEVVGYFDGVRYAQESREFVRLDLSKINYIDLATVTVLMAHMFDERLPRGYLTVVAPKNKQPSELFERVKFDETVTQGNSTNAHFLSRVGFEDKEEYKKDILERVTKFNNGVRDITLNPLLTEIVSNTNNHATLSKHENVPWLITMEEDKDSKTIKFCVSDLGIGVHERQIVTRTSMKKFNIRIPNWMASFFKSSQTHTLAQNIPHGLLSSTELMYRGQGMKNIYDIVRRSKFKTFNLITNKAHIDFNELGKPKEDFLQNFRGTLYYWSIRYEY